MYLRLGEPCRELFLLFGGVDGLTVGGEPESSDEIWDARVWRRKAGEKNMKEYNQVWRFSKILLFLVCLSKSTNRRQIEGLISDLLAQLQQMPICPHNWTFFPVDQSKPSPVWTTELAVVKKRWHSVICASFRCKNKRSSSRSFFWHFGSDWSVRMRRVEVWLRNGDVEFLNYEMTTLTLLELIRMFLDTGLLLCCIRKDEESQSWLQN